MGTSEPNTTGPRWWTVRPAQNLKPATYRCPLCDRHLPALSEHMLIEPEGSPAGRRHAHTTCVARARKAERLPSRDEWRATQPRRRGPSRACSAARSARHRMRSRAASWAALGGDVAHDGGRRHVLALLRGEGVSSLRAEP